MWLLLYHPLSGLVVLLLVLLLFVLFCFFQRDLCLTTTWSWSLVGKRGLRVITWSCPPGSSEHIFWPLQGKQGNTLSLLGLYTRIHVLHAFSSLLDFQESVRPRIFICIYSRTLQCSTGWILLSRSVSLKMFILGQTLFFQQQQQTNTTRWFQVGPTLCYAMISSLKSHRFQVLPQIGCLQVPQINIPW